MAPEAVIISSGSEVVSLAVAEATQRAGLPYAVIALVPQSVLRGAPGCTALVDLSGERGDWQRLRSSFLKALAQVWQTARRPLAIFPTEDGSLRLINECRDDVLAYGEFSRSRALRMGGVDKAEVVEQVNRAGLSRGIARSLVLEQPEDALSAFDALGIDAVIKPALKPLDMDLSGMGGHGIKVITRQDASEEPRQIVQRLATAWPLSQRWIAQPRLKVGPGLERSVCASRGASRIQACQVQEQAKYPRMGGTAFWVSMDRRRDLIPAATELMQTLDVVGLCELSYLPDADGQGQMIEFNPRPWLQLGLVEHAGFPIVAAAAAALRHVPQGEVRQDWHEADWLQPERMMLALLAGELSPLALIGAGCVMFKSSTTLGGYGSRIPRARSRLARRSLRKLLGR
ncbi:hypothetical protein ACS5PK_20340 [Roseateles sp. DB2]|uniref:hypothetical protein n=1 Tax=Roseateles sp. DB2 TaxID=3453717 RepID=UPI003EE9451A